MNTVKSSIYGWGAFSVAVLSGMYAANEWRQKREDDQVARGSKQMYIMTFEEKMAKAEWENEQAQLLAAGKEAHPVYVAEIEAQKMQSAKVGKSNWGIDKA
eukprot:m.36122 g.36122  ORF g.36122 m.36122 type:complete len:101 (-) comp17263_c0_seq1:28-330(-)